MKEKPHICDWKEGKTIVAILIYAIWHIAMLALCFGIVCFITNKLGVGYANKIEYPEETYKALEELQEVYIKEGESFDYMGLKNDYRVNSFNMWLYSPSVVRYGEDSKGIAKTKLLYPATIE